MIIADPLGNWVQGMHEGLQDSIAANAAQDSTAEKNYNLGVKARMAPIEQNNAELNNQVYRDVVGEGLPQRMARTNADLGDQRLAEGYARYAMPSMLIQQALQQNRHATIGTDGQIHFPVMGGNGTSLDYTTLPGNVKDPSVLANQQRMYYQNGRLNAYDANIESEIAARAARANGGYGGLGYGGYGSGGYGGGASYMTGLPRGGGSNAVPAASTGATPHYPYPMAPTGTGTNTGGNAIAPNAGATFNMGSSGSTGNNYSKFVNPNTL